MVAEEGGFRGLDSREAKVRGLIDGKFGMGR